MRLQLFLSLFYKDFSTLHVAPFTKLHPKHMLSSALLFLPFLLLCVPVSSTLLATSFQKGLM